MKKVLIFYLAIIPITLTSQVNKWKLITDFKIGISNFLDEKDNDAFNYKAGGLLGLSIQSPKNIIGFKGSMYYLINGAHNTKTEKNINISNIGVSQNLQFSSIGGSTLFSLGVKT
jgi:hypothetical protein